VKNRQHAGVESTDNAADEDSGSADPLNGAGGNEKLYRRRYTGEKRSKLEPKNAEEEKLQAVARQARSQFGDVSRTHFVLKSVLSCPNIGSDGACVNRNEVGIQLMRLSALNAEAIGGSAFVTIV